MAKKRPTRAGRKPLPAEERLGDVLHVRVSADQLAIIERAAALKDGKVATYVRDAALEQARRDLGEV